MKEKTLPAITTVLIALIAISLLLAVYISYGRGQKPANGSIGGQASVLLASGIATTSSRSSETPLRSDTPENAGAAPQTKASIGAASNKIILQRPGTAAVPSGVSGRACTANDLTGTASWTKFGAYLTGELNVRNSSIEDCVLSPLSVLTLYSGQVKISDTQTSGPSKSALILAGDEKKIHFTWSNWCGTKLRDPARLVFTLPKEAGYLSVPFISSLGRPQHDVPRCMAAGSNSTVDMWWL